MSDGNIDLFKYGQLVANVEALQHKIDKLEISVDRLLELANKSKGGFWMGMAFVSAISAFVGYFMRYWLK
jgi:hypothetical protein